MKWRKWINIKYLFRAIAKSFSTNSWSAALWNHGQNSHPLRIGLFSFFITVVVCLLDQQKQVTVWVFMDGSMSHQMKLGKTNWSLSNLRSEDNKLSEPWTANLVTLAGVFFFSLRKENWCISNGATKSTALLLVSVILNSIWCDVHLYHFMLLCAWAKTESVVFQNLRITSQKRGPRVLPKATGDSFFSNLTPLRFKSVVQEKL